MPSRVARKMVCLPSVMRAAIRSSSLSMAMAMMPRAMTLEKSLSGVFLTVPLRVAKKMNLPSSSRSRTGRMVRTFSPGCRLSRLCMALALAGGADVGNLVDLEPVDAAGVGEAEQEGVRGVDDELRDEVFFARLHADAARAAAALLAIDGDGRALEVALVGDGDGDLLVGDEVFELKLGGLVDDLGAALVAVLVANLFEFLDDDVAQLLVAGEDRLVLGDLVADLAELLEDFVDGELREAIELQLEDGVDLAEREAAFFVGQALAVEVDDDLSCPCPRRTDFRGRRRGSRMRG